MTEVVTLDLVPSTSIKLGFLHTSSWPPVLVRVEHSPLLDVSLQKLQLCLMSHLKTAMVSMSMLATSPKCAQFVVTWFCPCPSAMSCVNCGVRLRKCTPGKSCDTVHTHTHTHTGDTEINTKECASKRISSDERTHVKPCLNSISTWYQA